MGRNKKPLREVIEEMTEEFVELKEEVRGHRDDGYALHKKMDRLESKLNYWLKKVAKKDERA